MWSWGWESLNFSVSSHEYTLLFKRIHLTNFVLLCLRQHDSLHQERRWSSPWELCYTGTCVPSAQVTVGGSSLKSAKLVLQGRGLFSFKSHRLKNVRLGCGTFADLTWLELLVYTVPCWKLCQEIPAISGPGVQPLQCCSFHRCRMR